MNQNENAFQLMANQKGWSPYFLFANCMVGKVEQKCIGEKIGERERSHICIHKKK